MVTSLSAVSASLTITTNPSLATSSPTTLTCGAAAESLPNIAWFVDGNLIKGDRRHRYFIGNTFPMSYGTSESQSKL